MPSKKKTETTKTGTKRVWTRQKPAATGNRRPKHKGCFEKHIVGRVNRKLVDYWAVCDNQDCKLLKKANTRASEMPNDQFQVLLFF